MKERGIGGSSIRVVSARTGIPVDTLRVWERRYGFPKPARRAGGSRIYAEDDITRLQLVASALELGFRPGDVIALSQKELDELVAATRRDARLSPGADEPALTVDGSPLEAVLDALRRDDVVALRSVLRGAAVTLGPRAFVTELAHPLAVRVGELWASGDLDVRHEHLASASLTTQLRLLLGAFEDTERTPVVVLTTLPGEPHTLGLEMVAVYLAARASAPRLLGADTPPEQIADAARAFRADAVGIHVSPVADPARTAEDAKRLLSALPRETELWLGGGGAERVALRHRRVRQVATWSALDEAIAAVRETRAA